jgi:hypothetical protein
MQPGLELYMKLIEIVKFDELGKYGKILCDTG